VSPRSPVTSAEPSSDPGPLQVQLVPPSGMSMKVFLGCLFALWMFLFFVRASSWTARGFGLAGCLVIGWALFAQVRYHFFPPASIRVDDAGATLPARPYRATKAVTPHDQVKFAYVVKADSSPVLVVETRERAFEYPAANFEDRGDIRRLAQALNARARARA
jgi:hypothetical protein